jgi:hypothetical protein
MIHRRVLAVLTVAATVPFAACGDDDKDSKSDSATPKKVSMELKPAGKKATVVAPESIDAGVVTVDFKNSTKKGAGLQFVRIVGDHTPAEVIKTGNSWGDKGTPLPKWIELKGGVPNAPPGTSEVATQALEPGKYLALQLDGNQYAEFEVTGDGKGKVDAPAAAIDATEYSFKASGLKAGKSEVLFANKGGQPHFVVGLPMNPDATIKDVRTFFKQEKGRPPFSEKGGFDSPISDSGGDQVLTLDLKKGKYALVCFIPDRQGGPPHVAKGMISEAVVE